MPPTTANRRRARPSGRAYPLTPEQTEREISTHWAGDLGSGVRFVLKLPNDTESFEWFRRALWNRAQEGKRTRVEDAVQSMLIDQLEDK